jgi:hypothetical protein
VKLPEIGCLLSPTMKYFMDVGAERTGQSIIINIAAVVINENN